MNICKQAYEQGEGFVFFFCVRSCFPPVEDWRLQQLNPSFGCPGRETCWFYSFVDVKNVISEIYISDVESVCGYINSAANHCMVYLSFTFDKVV
jgi:hypothetical protein